MKPGLKIALSFVKALTGEADTPLRLRFLDDRKEGRPAFEIEAPVNEAWPEIEGHQADGYGVFYVLNECHPETDFASDGSVTRVRAVPADFDEGLPDDWEWHQHPDLIVHTSEGKGQALWLAQGLSVAEFKPTCRRLIALYRSDPAVQNLSRVLRLPGTLHQKGEPQLVTFEARDGGPVLDGLPELPPPKPASKAVGAPVPLAHLEKLLTYINPNSRSEWRDLVAAVRATNAGTEEERTELLLEKIDPAWHEDAGIIWETMPPKDGGIGFGTIYAKAAAAGYSGPATPSVGTIAETWGNVAAPEPEPPDPDTAERIRFLWPRDIAAMPDPTPLVEGIIMEGENLVLMGPPKKGKSLFTLDVALSIAANVPVLGKFKVHRSGPVIYLSSEGLTFLKQRMMAWLQARGLTLNDISNFGYITDVPHPNNPEEFKTYIDLIRKELGERQPVLVIIDTLSRSLGALKENDPESMNLYDEMARFIMRSFKCPCYTVAHVGKDRTKGLRGSNAAPANFDAVAELQEKDEGRVFSCTGRGGGDHPFGIVKAEIKDAIGETLTWASLDTVEKPSKKKLDDVSGWRSLKVVEALEELNAVGLEHSVTTSILLSTMYPMLRGETEEAWTARVEPHRRSLLRRAKVTFTPMSLGLSGYARMKGPRHMVWCLPEDFKFEEEPE